jgi:hypothetical protein
MSPDPYASAADLLMNGLIAAKEGDAARTRFYMEWVLRESTTHEQRAKALYYLSKVAQSQEEKIKLLEELLLADPSHPEARRSLAHLRESDPAIENNPTEAPATGPLGSRKSHCDQCGSKLVFSPDGKALECERCHIQYPAFSAGYSEASSLRKGGEQAAQP